MNIETHVITHGCNIRSDSPYSASNCKAAPLLLLKRLQIPGQFSQSERQGTSKTSFLFSGKDVGTPDLDSIYWISLNGLEELISMDPSFNKYTNTLFSEASRDFERSILTQEGVKKVDNSISGFLRLLSLYFMLRPAHKCLEWLVRVYEIHKCNIDGLMECVLSYYETNLFARVVQIIIITLGRPRLFVVLAVSHSKRRDSTLSSLFDTALSL